MKTLTVLFLSLLANQVLSSDIISLDVYYKNNFNLEKEQLSNRKIKIAVLDTGINIDNPKYSDRLIVDSRFNKTHKNNIKIPLNLIPFRNDKDSDHASHIVGIISTLSKNSLIIPLKVYDHKFGEQEKIKRTIDAINFCIKENVDIINYSIANGSFNNDEFLALKRASEKGIFVIVSSGNDNIKLTYEQSYPASYNLENIFVISGNHNNSPAGNYNNEIVDTSLPYEVFSTLSQGYKRKKGTSMSTAFFTGLLARKMVQKKLSYSEVRNQINLNTKKSEKWKNINKSQGFLEIDKFDSIIASKEDSKKEQIEKIDNMILELSLGKMF